MFNSRWVHTNPNTSLSECQKKKINLTYYFSRIFLLEQVSDFTEQTMSLKSSHTLKIRKWKKTTGVEGE